MFSSCQAEVAGRENLARDSYLQCDGPFHLVDLVSQGAAVQRYLRGWSLPEKLEWLAAHGKLEAIPQLPGYPQSYIFESDVGLSCFFFIRGDQFFFNENHTTFTVDG